MEITRDRQARTISLSQEFYIDNVLKRFEMELCTPVATPLPLQHLLTAPAAPLTGEVPLRGRSEGSGGSEVGEEGWMAFRRRKRGEWRRRDGRGGLYGPLEEEARGVEEARWERRAGWPLGGGSEGSGGSDMGEEGWMALGRRKRGEWRKRGEGSVGSGGGEMGEEGWMALLEEEARGVEEARWERRAGWPLGGGSVGSGGGEMGEEGWMALRRRKCGEWRKRGGRGGLDGPYEEEAWGVEEARWERRAGWPLGGGSVGSGGGEMGEEGWMAFRRRKRGEWRRRDGRGGLDGL
ncbi:unnamed protein product [Closterium sp. NIES-65]|nr:unnamed protein product [Closterium sp. NIES-65]